MSRWPSVNRRVPLEHERLGRFGEIVVAMLEGASRDSASTWISTLIGRASPGSLGHGEMMGVSSESPRLGLRRRNPSRPSAACASAALARGTNRSRSAIGRRAGDG